MSSTFFQGGKKINPLGKCAPPWLRAWIFVTPTVIKDKCAPPGYGPGYL